MFGWTFSEGNQDTGSKKTMLSLWFMTLIGKGQMFETVKILRLGAGENLKNQE